MTALASRVLRVNVTGGKTRGITTQLLWFDLKKYPEFQKIRFNLCDCPGVESDNYQGEEIPLILEGVMPPDTDILNNKKVLFSDVAHKRSPPEEERKRRIHAVIFVVPAGVQSDTLKAMAKLYADVTIKYSENHFLLSILYSHFAERKAIVVISQVDLFPNEDERETLRDQVCQGFSIDSSLVHYLQNYVDAKDKVFHIDKNVVQVFLAALSACDDFLRLSTTTTSKNFST